MPPKPSGASREGTGGEWGTPLRFLTKRKVDAINAERRKPRRHGRRGWGPAAK